MERTLVLIKPDGVKRAIIGAVISRFETAGLKVVGLKMVWPTAKQAETHYPEGDQWKETWARTKKGYEEKGAKFDETLEHLTDRLRSGLIKYLGSGPIVAIAVEGNESIACVRKICGATSPARADPSTIRGTYSTDSYEMADKAKRSLKNILHVSDSVASAEREINVWFTKEELQNYKRGDEDTIY